MLAKDHVWHIPQRRVVRQRLRRADVESRSGNSPVPQRRDLGILIKLWEHFVQRRRLENAVDPRKRRRAPPHAFPRVAAALPYLGTLASDAQFAFGLQALVTGIRPEQDRLT